MTRSISGGAEPLVFVLGTGMRVECDIEVMRGRGERRAGSASESQLRYEALIRLDTYTYQRISFQI